VYGTCWSSYHGGRTDEVTSGGGDGISTTTGCIAAWSTGMVSTTGDASTGVSHCLPLPPPLYSWLTRASMSLTEIHCSCCSRN